MNEDKNKQESLENKVEHAAGGRVLELEKNCWYAGPDDKSLKGASFFDNKKEAFKYAKNNGWSTKDK